MSSGVIRFCRISDDERYILPSRGTPGSAGFDLFSPITVTIPANGRCLVKTGWRVRLPRDKFFHIRPRSGLAVKGIDVGAGVVDSDYDGEIGVVLYNFNSEPFTINAGDRIAQGILQDAHLEYTATEVQELPPLQEEMAVRGTGGFGSTDSS